VLIKANSTPPFTLNSFAFQKISGNNPFLTPRNTSVVGCNLASFNNAELISGPKPDTEHSCRTKASLKDRTTDADALMPTAGSLQLLLLLPSVTGKERTQALIAT
jgi:hypothetical protein